MPANIIKSFSDKSGKSEQEVERLWDKAKKIVKDEYPEVGTDSDRYYSLVTVFHHSATICINLLFLSTL